MRARLAIAFAALAALLVAPAGASASVALVFANTLQYGAAAGEANNLSVSQSGTTYTFTDPGATITPGAGCAAVNANQVTCTHTGPDFILIVLGDGGDRATISDSVILPPGNSLEVGGEAGGDILTAGDGAGARLLGGDDVDTLIGGSEGDQLEGGPGGDGIDGGDGNDSLEGGTENDVMTGGPGFDSFDGGPGIDGADVFIGGPDPDSLQYFSRDGNLTIDQDNVADDGENCAGGACEGDNVRSDIEQINGGSGDDTISGAGIDNRFFGSNGDDVLSGGGGSDQLSGSSDDDRVLGGRGNDDLSGSSGDDTLRGGAGDDVLQGAAEDDAFDLLSGGKGLDLANYGFTDFSLRIDLDGRPDDGVGAAISSVRDNVGADMENLIGGESADRLVGNARANEIDGGRGADRIVGGKGPDGLNGDTGADRIVAGGGRDLIEGGGGPDRIASRGGGPDQVGCGSSTDRVTADRADRIEADCDRVSRGR